MVCHENEVTGGWRKLYNEELHSVYSSPSIIRMIKSRKMRWTGHVARMRRRRVHKEVWWKSQKEGDQKEDLEEGGKIILKWILER
jgi:hypothetical protein